MKTLVTKKNTLIMSFLGTIFFSLLIILGTESCYRSATCKIFRDTLSLEDFSVLVLSPTLLLFSLITYKMRDEIFETWMKFALWWTGATVILVLLAPANDPSLLPVTKSVIALASTAIFTIISSTLVLWERSILKGKN